MQTNELLTLCREALGSCYTKTYPNEVGVYGVRRDQSYDEGKVKAALAALQAHQVSAQGEREAELTDDRIIEIAESVGMKFNENWGTCYTGNAEVVRVVRAVLASIPAENNQVQGVEDDYWYLSEDEYLFRQAMKEQAEIDAEVDAEIAQEAKSKRIAITEPMILAIDYRQDGTIACVWQATESDKIVQTFALGIAAPQPQEPEDPITERLVKHFSEAQPQASKEDKGEAE